MKIIYFFVLVCISSFGSTAQTKQIDYSQEIRKIKTAQLADTALVNTWLQISKKIVKKRPDSALFFANQALLVAEKKDWYKGVATAHFYSGVALRTIGNYQRAMTAQFKALQIYEKLKDSIGIGNTFSEIATIYWFEKDYNKAIYYDSKALVIAEAQQDKDKICRTLNNIGVLKHDKGAYQEALTYYLRSLKIAEELKEQRRIASAYHNIGETYASMGNTTEGLEYLQKGLEIGKQLEDKDFMANTLVVIANIYLKKNQIEKSLQYAEQSLELAKNIGSKQYVQDASEILYADYKALQNMNKALEYHELYVTYKDSLFDETNHRQIAHIQATYELDKKQKEIENLEKEFKLKEATAKLNEEKAENHKIINYSLTVFCLLILVIGYMIYKNNEQNKSINLQLLTQKNEIEQQNQELAKQKDQISQKNHELSIKNDKLMFLNAEKDGLVGIVAHDLRAPLNRIKGFAQILSFEENLNEEQLMLLKRIDKTCNAGISLIKDLLIINNIEYENTKIVQSKIDLALFLKNFLEQFEAQAHVKNIRLHLQKNNKPLSVETDETFLSRILDNLISNAIKFTETNKNVFISFGEQNQQIFISIKDEGQGLSKQDQQKMFIKFQKLSAKPTGGEESTGLGLAIVKALVDKLEGEIMVVSEEGKGAEFIVKLPKKT
jgi:signal transduction histidine kinase